MLIFRMAVFVALAITAAAAANAQQAAPEAQAMIEFQRALDDYAFQHRQVERRAGASADQRAIAAGMRAARPSPQDGDLFTPLVAAAFHARINRALRGGCKIAAADTFVVPRPNHDATATAPIPACLATALPRLPAELEYRTAGVVLALVDTHANLVIDVLHGAFP